MSIFILLLQHPDYDSDTLANNLALVHLSEPVNAGADTIELVPRLSTGNLDKLVPKKDRCTSSSFGPDGELLFSLQEVS